MSKKNQSMRVIDAPMYNYWQALYMSFYSGRLYVDVAKRWRGFGVLYLLLVIAITSIPLSLRIVYDFNQYFDEQMILPLTKIPPLYVQNGGVLFDKPMPFFIKNKAGAVVAIVDTTGKVKSIDSTYPQLSILITKNKLYFRPPRFHLFFDAPKEMRPEDTFVQPVDKASNEVFDAKAWISSSGIMTLKRMTELFVYPLVMMFIFGLYVVLMLALAFLGQLFAVIIFKFKMPYKMAARIFLVASTVQIVVFFTLLTSNVVIPGIGFLYMVLLAVYFNYGILCVKRESTKMVRQ
jgi:hypothetical protein